MKRVRTRIIAVTLSILLSLAGPVQSVNGMVYKNVRSVTINPTPK